MEKSKKYKYPLLNDKNWLIEQYVVNKKSLKDISILVGNCTKEAVRYAIVRNHIELRDEKYKYPLLNDKDWLIQKYVVELLSTQEIANIIKCHKSAVREALIRNNINLRDSTETNKYVTQRKGLKSNKYTILNSEEWLKDKYLNENLSLPEIAELVGAKNHNSVRQALLRLNIITRNISEGLTAGREEDGFEINKTNLDVFNGCMLGDAGMQKWNRYSDYSNAYFYKKNIHKDHIDFVSSKLFKSSFEDRVKLNKSSLNNKIHYCYAIRSLSHKFLIPYYEKWYPKSNDYVKVVPRDLEINETVLLHWFLDDGYSSDRKRKYSNGWKQKKRQIKIAFCSESFTKEDQQILCNKINDKFYLGAKLIKTKGGTGWRIKIPQSKSNEFFQIIGPSPVPSLAYKWKIVEN